MKSIKNYALALVAMLVMVAGVNAQSRYKHMPRVKVDKTYVKPEVKKEKPSTTTASYVNTEVNTNTEVATDPVAENTTVASSTKEEVVIENHKTKSVVKNNKKVKTVKSKKTVNFKEMFNNMVKKSSKLFEVKKVEKTSLQTWLLLVIILGAAGLFLIILYLILFFATFSLWLWFLWLLGVLCITAAIVFLVLGLTGVMS